MYEKLLRRMVMLLSMFTLCSASFVFIGSGQLSSAPDKYNTESIRIPFDNKIYPVAIPDTLSFAGEPVPLNDPDIRQRLDRELLVNTYWHSQTLLILKQFKQVAALVEPMMKQYNLPPDFVYLCIAESGMQPNAVSPTGAVGLWQFLESTGEKFGLEINGEVDERMNFEKSTEAACKYLLEAKEIFGNWTLAAASFNMGTDGLQNVLQKQLVSNYYDLYTNRETARYIFRILALKIVLQHAEEYGFYLNEADQYPQFKFYSVNIDSPVPDWTQFAKEHGTNYKTLKRLNPWLQGYSLSNRQQKMYEVKLPLND